MAKRMISLRQFFWVCTTCFDWEIKKKWIFIYALLSHVVGMCHQHNGVTSVHFVMSCTLKLTLLLWQSVQLNWYFSTFFSCFWLQTPSAMVSTGFSWTTLSLGKCRYFSIWIQHGLCKFQEQKWFALFDLILYVPSTIFQLSRDGSSWVEPVLS